ncbi:MAG: glyceraldehyde-3-phosphate dehydrogenase [Crocinitomicaceae bacterium]|nr:glyceraldehyde-3-phosphate dehydrogenase [Crocinitomicaceae bacterium]|tara:strand:- start:11330 stop:12793 length:1464 start_codon:yes stop_codon:yes gene_type:complete
MSESNTTVAKYSKTLDEHLEKERAAIELIAAVGTLMYEKQVELVLFRNHLLDHSSSEILRLHKYAGKVVEKPINVRHSSRLAKLLCEMDLAPAKIDIGKLSYEYGQEQNNYASKQDFLNDKLGNIIANGDNHIEPVDVVLYGFGRIGRLAARELVKQAGKGQQLRLRAIVTRTVNDAQILKRAALLQNDSVHGPFEGTVDVDLENRCIVLNGQQIHIIEAKQPEDPDYTAYGIHDCLLIDNTGVFTNREALSRHTQAKGVHKVLLTAPGKEIPNIVYAINQDTVNIDTETIYSAASCTTNAISPVLKVIEDKLGVEKGHIETVHAYTNDQNLLDNMHKKPRRGRSAAINMVITSTGAGKAVTKVIPSFENKLTANAVRVPTPNGSLAILSLSVNKETTRDEVNALLKSAALEGNLVNQIFFSMDEEMVSNDIIGNTCCSVFDSPATIVSNDGKNIILYVWYDNEFGYTKQVIRLAKYIAKVRRLHYY